MTPLMAIFVSEARDLLDSVGKGLLVLENSPGETPVIHSIFRALHTLKGSSGLFDPELAPLTRLFHAGEDLLDEVRKERMAFTSAMADQLLALVDRVGDALDAVEEDHFQPDLEAGPCAHLASRLRGLLGQTVVAPRLPLLPPPPADVPAWLPDPLPPLARQQGQSAVALRYQPEADCFFFGSDPLLMLRQIPELIHLHLDFAPALEDPFQCRLSAVAVSLAPLAQLEALLASEGTQITLHPLAATAPPPALLPYPHPQVLVRLLAEQQAILELPCQREEWLPRLQATARVVQNALHRAGNERWSPQVQQAVQQALGVRGCEPLLHVVRAMLDGLAPRQEKTAPADPPGEEPAPREEGGRGKVLKVDQARIDRLMDLTGELVVAKNTVPFLAEKALTQYNNPALSQEILEFFGLIHRLSNDLQSAVMQVRMLPVMHVFQRFPRLVRDISRKLEKKVNLVMSGGDTEADKNVIESLADPLIHLIRNSLDHGLESPAERQQAGKPEQGEIHLMARQENDRVVLEITDDGRGIDPVLVRAKALEKGLITAKRHDELDDFAAIQLIFAPGFSTVATVSDLSGRGVGMDAVKTVVENFGGRIQLNSQPGKGTRVRMEMPLSMAVTRVMLVAASHALYGIPLDQVVETVRIPGTAIHRIKGRETTTLRGKILPLERMSRLLGDPLPAPREEEAILVVRPWEEEIGLVVDDFNKGMDVILKPLEGVVAGSRGCAGGALLGDGSVLLVLNLQELL